MNDSGIRDSEVVRKVWLRVLLWVIRCLLRWAIKPAKRWDKQWRPHRCDLGLKSTIWEAHAQCLDAVSVMWYAIQTVESMKRDLAERAQKRKNTEAKK